MTDCQIQTQSSSQCVSFWNDEKELCLAGHCDFYACDAVDSSSSHVQVLDAILKWVFNSNTSMIACFKTYSVQILGFKFYVSHAPTIPMASIKLLLAISAHTDLDLF